ncbi:response regulator transcription factor [Nocardia thailandica]|uniref:response regulator transcription factor n=1 Tax=Nocardia thailandica TaxID=257275 RepID=UPI00031B137A|nr:response regulator transcription factor [Nocardia thailandica]
MLPRPSSSHHDHTPVTTTPARLLIIEDDVRVRCALRLAMEDEGYLVEEAESAETALRLVDTDGIPDVVIVDLMLGDTDGFTCIRELRRDHDVPIIVVSARDDTHDVVAALEVGADDFVTKPYEVKELTARIRALRRRSRPLSTEREPTDHVLDAAPDRRLVLHRDHGSVRLAGQPLHLTLTEFRLLCELVDHSGLVLSRQLLLDRVWDRAFHGDERIVDVHIRRLRTKIERDPADPQIVKTVRGLGYRFDAQV